MKINEVLEKVDTLYPNAYTEEEKLRWCYDVSCGIRRNVMTLYDESKYTVAEDGEALVLPVGVSMMDVESIFVNDRRENKLDYRSVSGSNLQKGDEIRLVYKSIPQMYDNLEAETEVPSPYDSLYIDYVCAQISFFQNALSDYQKFMMMYNEKLSEFAAEYRRTAPVVEGRTLKNLW